MEIYDLEIKLKSYLNRHKIRLCDSPYTIDNEEGEELKKLAEILSKEFSFDIDKVKKSLNNLRTKAVNNIKCNYKFKNENICTIKIHRPKSNPDLSLEILQFKDSTGLELKQEISKLLLVAEHNIKIIFKGKLIIENEKLINQGIINNSKVMVLFLSENDMVSNEDFVHFQKSKNLVEYLSKRAIDGQFKYESMNVEITNQAGEVLYLTKDQKSYLTFGLAMHQQAISAIIHGNYHLALLYGLEADQAFTQSQYCDSVDNTAILQLDIVWCYYCLQSIDEIPNAKNRLDTCEKWMKKCYGEGNERINRIREKQSFEGIPESINVFRLYLLKAIIAFYENDTGNCRELLLRAVEVYRAFMIPETLITEVMVLGFSREQSIEGLRVYKNINQCVDFILKREEEKRSMEVKKQEKMQRIAISKHLGNTANNLRIDVQVLERLINQSHMDEKLCLAAIRRANNNFHEAWELLFTGEQQLLSDIAQHRKEGLVTDGNLSYECIKKEKEAINQIAERIDIDRSVIKRCLRQTDGNIELAMEKLMDENSNFINESSTSNDESNSESSQQEIEQQLYETIGEGSKHNSESRYINPDLTNEIVAFNKFARLLKMPEIVYDENIATW